MSRVHARNVVALCLIASLAAQLPVAIAVAAARAVDPRELEARRDFAEARYEEALHIFAQLFSESGDPIYLRNLARCYQKLKRPAEAIAGFEDYLVKGNLAPGERDEIESYIAEMRALQSAERAPAVAPNERAHATRGALVEAPRTAAPAQPAAARPAPLALPAPADGGGRRVLRITGLAAGAAGVVLLGVGVGYGMAARSAQREVEYQYDPTRDANGSHYERLQWIAYAAGGVALATGLGLLISSLVGGARSSERSESHALVSPGGLGWETTF